MLLSLNVVRQIGNLHQLGIAVAQEKPHDVL
jgi:hypothetical protein